MLNEALTKYIDLHQSLGFKFRTQRLLLRNFVSFAEAHGDEFVQVARVLDWARQAPSPPQRRNRLFTVRRFAMALHAEDPRHELPPADAFGRAWFERRVPHVYRPDEIAALMKAAAALKPSGSIRPLMYATLFGLLAATGMRISEALALRLEDLTEDGLVIRETKFKKSRLLPLHETTHRALDRYLAVRSRLGTSSPIPPQRRRTRRSWRPFCDSRARSDCERRPAREVLASMTCGTASPCGPCNPADTSGRRSPATSSRSARISVMATSPIPTGTFRQPQP
jgi:integrase